MGLKSLKDYDFDGKNVLRSLLKSSTYEALPQAVASLTAFAHPETVKALSGQNVFRNIRGRSAKDLGNIINYQDGKLVMYDDDKGPADAFIWAHGINDDENALQVNHIWPADKDVTAYTNLANICMMPAFLSKLCGVDPSIQDLLRYRSFQLFDGYKPDKEMEPEEPDGYGGLDWMEPLDLVEDIESVFRAAMKGKAQDRTAKSARIVGWVFSNYHPDHKL